MAAGGTSHASTIATPAHQEFRFVATPRSLVRATLWAVAGLGVFYAWARWTRHVPNVIGSTEPALLLASAALAIAFTVGQQWSSARKGALQLGHIELHQSRLRWQRADGFLTLDVPWEEVERATIDTRHRNMLLHRKNGSPVLLGAVSARGNPSELIVLERFAELAELVGGKVASAPHDGSSGAQAGRRTVLLGLGVCGLAVIFHRMNELIASSFHWSQVPPLMPRLVGGIGAIVMLSGARLLLGQGGIVSPLYGLGYRRLVVRLLIVAALLNFSLLALENMSGTPTQERGLWELRP